MFLYYGNPRAAAPRYDLSLVARQLLTAERVPAALGAEEQLKPGAWPARASLRSGGLLFWGILALVVVALLIIIARLLPKSTTPA